MSCINKSLPGYKNLAKIYGDSVAESFVRGYSKQIKLLPDNEFYYPSPSEVTKHLASHRKDIVETIEFVLDANPNISEEALKGLLRGVAHMHKGAFYITSGVKVDSDSIISDVQLSNIFRPNFKIIQTLVDKFPNIFSISNTQKKSYVKILNITAPKGKVFDVSTSKENGQDAQIRSKYFSDGAVQKTSDVLQKIADSKHPLNKLAKHLLGFSQINNVNIVLEDVPFLENPTGVITKPSAYYNPGKNDIHIAEKAAFRQSLSEKTILHEILHALSTKLTNENTEIGKELTRLYKHAVANLGEYNPKTGENYALLDIDEFFVGLFTDAPFIQKLKTVPAVDGVKYQNLFQELIDYILDLLKLDKASSLYDQAFGVATHVLEYQKEMQAVYSESAALEKEFLISQGMLEEVMLQQKGTELTKASPKTIKMIKDFLTRIGVNYEQVKDIVVNGKKLDANAIANITQKLIQIVDGKEDIALPEEAMHFAIELIQQNDPKLFNQLLKEINDYQILKDVYADYGNNPLYQTKEGKPDILKLKKEAMGKVLAEVVIGKSQGLSESSDRIAKVQTWWQKVIDFLKKLFMKSGFDTAAMKIVSGEEIGNVEDVRSEEDNLFLQKASQSVVYDRLKLIKSQMRLENDGYYVNGKKVPKRVSDIVKTWYEHRFADNSLTDSEYQKSVYELKMEKGTAGHSDLEYIFSLFVDDEGFLRDEPLDDSGYVSQINNDNRDMYNILKKNLEARLNSFPKDNGGTRFMSEAMVYDERRELGGTVDFLAIEPDGKVNILDWKFMDLDIDKWEDVPWYKISAWQKQMEQYKLILQSVYGVKNEDFKQTRMIPIKAFYSKGDAKAKTLPKLLNIAIGDVVVENITDDYLVPVGLESEKTGEAEIDDLLVKLNALYSKLSEKKVTPEGKIAKRDQLNSLFSAIRQLQMKKNVKPLIIQARLLNAQIQTVIKEYDSVWKGKDASSFADDVMGNFYKELDTLENALTEVYANLDTDLEFLFQERELSDEDKLIQEELRNTANTARYLAKKVDKVGTEFVKMFVVGKEGVKKDITLPEKIIKGITRLFSSTSTLQTTAMDVLFKKANRVLAYAGQDTITESKKLQAIKKKFDTWASARGISKKNYFDIIKKKGKNELVDEFEPEFYSELKSRIKDRDYAWIRDNVDQDSVRAETQRKLDEEIQRINDKVRPGLDTDKEDMDKEIYKVSSLYDVSTPTSVGWLVYDVAKKFPKKDKWESKEWKELTKTENAPAKAFYDYIIERNKYYQSIKYINAADARVFLPFVRKSLIEKVFVGGDIKFGEEFLRSISIDEGDVGYGQIDPFTGQPLNKIPKYFTNEIEGELSNDLFRNMALYNETAIKFKYLTDIEDQLSGLLNVERNKQAIATSMFGKTVYEDGKIKYTPNNSENSKLLEDMIKAIVYQQRYIQSETFDQILGTIGNFGERANKRIGIKIFPENLVGRQVSINKVITQLNNTFQLNALGLNPLSALSNLLGGTFQSIINAETYFSRVDYEGTLLWMMANKMTQGPNQKLAVGALEYFLPLTDNYNKEIAKTLSINTLSQENVQEFLMILMRKSDYLVQSNNFYAFLRNTIVDGDRVINVREYLREQPEYKDMYAGGEKAIKDRKDKFEEDAKKLIEEKAVLKLATIVDGEFVIPGVDRKSNSVIELRRKVQQLNKDALGNLTEDDMRTINMTVYGKSFMIFKNWIPRLVDVRLGNLKYNSGSDAYEWGRMRNVYRIISEDVIGSISNLVNSLKANDKGVDFMRKLYEKKKSDYETDTGKTLDMTESQFMDLVRKNIKGQMVDLIFLLTLFAIYAGLKANAPEDEEDEAVKNQYKFMLRAADKVKDELLYFYNPASITSLVSSGIFPSMSYLTNFSKVLKNFMLENYAIAIGDKELEDKNYVIKYLMKSFPVSNQAAGMLPMFYPELAKSLGIKAQSQAKPMGL
jgi:hypothetical protein